jgi:hypothetical protein
MSVVWKAIQQNHELADGGVKQRLLGYRLEATLTWGEGWIRQEDLSGLTVVCNDPSASLTFTPRPNSTGGLTYEVIWANKFEFPFHEGRFGTYGGTIELIGPNITATAGVLP